MRFSFKGFALTSVVLLLGSVSIIASAEQSSEITVLVYNTAHISPAVLEPAEFQAAGIFHAAGIDVVWVNCLNDPGLIKDACRHPLDSREFVLHIVPTGKTRSDLVFGISYLDDDGTGRYSDIFFDHIEEGHRRFGANVAQLMGSAAAHELGHLLLGAHAHSQTGIMTAVWERDTLLRISMRNLLFSREQASRMQARIHQNDLRAAGFAGGK